VSSIATGRELSPTAHARIRRHIALIPAYVLLVSAWLDTLRRLPIGPHGRAHLVRDFAAIAYLPGIIARRHDLPALYDVDRRSEMLAQLLPTAPPVRYPPFYGPQISVLFEPIAKLPYPTALAAWMAITLAAYLVCGYAIWRTCPRLRDRAGTIGLLLFADPTLYYTLSFVQISALAIVCVTGGYLALRAGRPLLAGVCLGSLVYKPSLGVAIGVVFVCAMEWRIILGAIAGAAAQFAAAAIFWGPSILGEYLRAQVRLIPDMRDEFYIHHLQSWRGFFEILGVPDAFAQVGYAIAAACVLFVAWRCWRADVPLPVRYAVVLVATVLVNPHGYVYDSMILMPAFLLLWDWSETIDGGSAAIAFEWLLYFCYFAPWFAIVAIVTHVQLSVPALTLLMVAAARLSVSRRRIGY
jgi:hypothetical protein